MILFKSWLHKQEISIDFQKPSSSSRVEWVSVKGLSERRDVLWGWRRRRKHSSLQDKEKAHETDCYLLLPGCFTGKPQEGCALLIKSISLVTFHAASSQLQGMA